MHFSLLGTDKSDMERHKANTWDDDKIALVVHFTVRRGQWIGARPTLGSKS